MLPNNFVFFGTDEFAVFVLTKLAEHNLRPTLIITTPGKSQRRGKVIDSPVQTWAQKNGVEFDVDPKQLKADSYKLFIVASYGKILPQKILDLAEHGTLNIHPSLLPKYRGPSPLQSQILSGEQAFGVTIMQLDAEMDHGPILAARTLPNTGQNYAALCEQAAALGAELLIETLPQYLAGKLELKEQNHAQATYTKKFSKADAELKPADPDELKYRKVLALNPEPGTWMIDHDIRLKIKSAHLADGHFLPDRVVPEGKREMTWADYLRGK